MDFRMVDAARARLGELPAPDARLAAADVVGAVNAGVVAADAGLVERAVAAPAPAEEDIAAALTLVEDIRGQAERLEAQVVRLARRRGMPWPQIADAQGHRSPQAATQRYQRLVTRLAEQDDTLEARDA